MDITQYNTNIGERLPINAVTIDHRIPKSKGGSNDKSNLVLACYGCNSEKSDGPDPRLLSTLLESA
jgi:5-methylcytosine-specific restriction endonuclease McrA